MLSSGNATQLVVTKYRLTQYFYSKGQSSGLAIFGRVVADSITAGHKKSYL